MKLSGISNMLHYYSTHSAVTNPKEYARLYDSLPEEVEDISKVLQNILLHNWRAHAEGVRLTAQRRAEIEIRPITRLLARIHEVDPSPWNMERPMDSLVVVDCRHFATLLCSILRHRGVPARVRHGFAAYLETGHNQSHVICEYWDDSQGRWVPADPDTVQHDMPGNRFMTADVAWRGIMSGTLDVSQFGYAADMRGEWCVRWEVVRDFAALNKQEMLTFDVWGVNVTYVYNDALFPEDATLLNHITALLLDNSRHFDELRAIYKTDERVRVPTIIRSQPYTTGLTHVIDLAVEGAFTWSTRWREPSGAPGLASACRRSGGCMT